MIHNAFRTKLSRSNLLRSSALLLGTALASACDASAVDNNDGAGGTTATGSGGTVATGSGGVVASGGASTGVAGASVAPGFGTPAQKGMGTSDQRYAKAATLRNDANYFFIANGWGPGFQSQTVSWLGSSFTVVSMAGTAGPQYQPASYPAMFCGKYSDQVSGECGLPKALNTITSLRTGWRWKANGNASQYNASYDIWLSSSADIGGKSAYLMVWLRDPPGQQPAGSVKQQNLTVTNVPSTWNLWVGSVGGLPYVAYVRPEGSDLPEIEFDVMDFVRDAASRSISLPGTNILSVAVGFEIWTGPITNLVSDDFYVDVR